MDISGKSKKGVNENDKLKIEINKLSKIRLK